MMAESVFISKHIMAYIVSFLFCLMIAILLSLISIYLVVVGFAVLASYLFLKMGTRNCVKTHHTQTHKIDRIKRHGE